MTPKRNFVPIQLDQMYLVARNGNEAEERDDVSTLSVASFFFVVYRLLA